VAAALEQRARSVADALAGGDGCTARTRAQALVSAVTQAVNHKQIPPRLLEPLTSSANDLASRISCAPVPKPATVPPPEPKPRPKHHGKAKGHHKKKHGGGD
jgi:hypothetical protein